MTVKNVDYVFARQVGNRIRFQRMRKDMGQKELSKKVGVSQPVISSWERGEYCLDLYFALKVSRVLEVQIFELIPEGYK